MHKKNKYTLVFILLILLMNINNYSISANDLPFEVNARNVLLIEETTGKVLYSKNPNEKIYPASTTKILTSIVAMEYIDENEIYIIGDEINEVPWNSSKAGNVIGESILGNNLLRGMLLPSGNETSVSVAKIVATKKTGKDNLTYDEYINIFSELMNKKAKEIGCTNTNFINPHGYHDDNHYTTASDLAIISQEFLKNKILKSIVKEDFFTGDSAGAKIKDGMITITHNWYNSNALLTSKDFYYEYATGLKTGYTNEAGKCLIASAEKDGKSLISVLMFSEDPGRWNDTIELFNYGFNNFEYQTFSLAEQPLAELNVNKPQLGKPSKLNIYSRENYTGFFSNVELANIVYEIEYFDDKVVFNEFSGKAELIPSILPNDEIGVIDYFSDDVKLFSMPLVLKESVEERTFKSDVLFFVFIIKDNAFTKKALPFWIGFLILVLLLIILITSSKRNRRERRGFDLKRK